MAKIIYYILQSILFTRVIHRPIVFTWLVIDKEFFNEEQKKEHECHISRKKEAVFSNLQQRHLIT